MLDEGYAVNIMGRVYRVEYSHDLKPKLFGDCDTGRGIIRINATMPKPTQHETLTHEVIHAILYESGMSQLLTLDGLEEGLVRALERGLFTAGMIREHHDNSE